MVTAGVIYHSLRALTLPVDIRNICVLLAPGFSGLTAFATYLLTSEMSESPSAGLLAAAFMGITPGYISRSVAGSYDNEAIAIFLLVQTFYFWIKAVKTGSVTYGGLCALFTGYMAASWGGERCRVVRSIADHFRLRLYHQSGSIPRICSDMHGKIQPTIVYQLHNLVRDWYACQHEHSFHWLSPDQE